MPELVKAIFKVCGLDVRRARNTLRARRWRLFRERGINLVFDVGANIGQYARELRRCGYKGRIVSFEPQPTVFGRLEREFSGDPNHGCYQLALGRLDCTSRFRVARQHASSSLLDPREEFTSAFPGTCTHQEIEVPVRRLDSLAREVLRGDERAYLKIDTQGSEKEVLLGASHTLSQVLALELELSLIPLYEGQPLLAEMFGLTSDLGFMPIWIEAGVRDPRTNDMLEVDVLFVKRTDLGQ